MPVKEIVSEIKHKMDMAVGVLHDGLKSIRTSRASTGLVENLKIRSSKLENKQRSAFEI